MIQTNISAIKTCLQLDEDDLPEGNILCDKIICSNKTLMNVEVKNTRIKDLSIRAFESKVYNDTKNIIFEQVEFGIPKVIISY